jgi:hypothetical protein
LAGAKNLAEIVELQAAYWRKQFSALTAKAEEVRALSTMVTAAAAEPINAHVTNGMDEMRKVQTERLGLPVKSSELPDQGPDKNTC